jgi:hypothetical protein
MPLAVRVIDKVADLSDWNQSTFTDGLYVQWDATSGKFVGSAIDFSTLNTITGLNTAGLTSAGLAGYISANNTLQPGDNLSLSTCSVVGFSNGTSGSLVVGGIITCKFTTVGGSPNPGQTVFLAASTDEVGAAGKLTATAPNSGVLLAIGFCLDNTNYSSLKECNIVFQIKSPIQL